MRASSPEGIAGIALAAAVLIAAHGVAAPPGAAEAYARTAQEQAAAPDAIVAAEVAVSNSEARLHVERADGETLTVALSGGRVLVDGRDVGGYSPGDELDRSWRALLRAAIDTPPEELAVLLSAWPPPAGSAGEAIAATFAARVGPGTPAAPPATAEAADSIERLQARFEALERMLRELESPAAPAGAGPPAGVRGRPAPGHGPGFFGRIAEGFAGLVSTLVGYGLMLAIGCTLVYFGRRYVEGVADTVRHAAVRSGIVGLAATVLVLPAFAVGAVALAISVVGIPLLLVWVPVFPVAVVATLVFGFIGVAHAAGEAMAERRLHGAEWLRANSYYFIATGLALLAAAFVAACVAHMAGPWLEFARAILLVIGVIVTWIAFTLGFGAVLLSRIGTRPVRSGPDAGLSLPFDE